LKAPLHHHDRVANTCQARKKHTLLGLPLWALKVAKDNPSGIKLIPSSSCNAHATEQSGKACFLFQARLVGTKSLKE